MSPEAYLQGQRVMAALHGVCEVLEVRSSMLVLKPQEAPYVVQIPLPRAGHYGVRPLLDASQLRHLLRLPAEPRYRLSTRPWERYAEWMERLCTAEPGARLSVLREVDWVRRFQGPLTPEEVRLLNRLRRSLEQEIALVLNASRSEASALLDDALLAAREGTSR